MKKILWFIVFLLAALNVQADSQLPASSILALPFENATNDKALDGLKDGIPDILIAFLSPYTERMIFVDRTSVESMCAEQGLNLQGLVDSKASFKIGTMVQAQYILRGSFHKEKGQLSIEVMLYDTSTTALVKSFSADGAPGSLSGICQTLAYAMSDFFKVSLKKIDDLPVDDNPKQNALMIEALGFYYNGQYPQALAQFMKVLEADEHDEAASYWLVKTYGQAGMNDHAQIEAEAFLKNFPASEKAAEVEKILSSPNLPAGRQVPYSGIHNKINLEMDSRFRGNDKLGG